MRPLTRRSEKAPVTELRRNMDKLLENIFNADPWWTDRAWLPAANGDFLPPADIVETEDAYEVKVELPGMEAKDVDVEVFENVLTIRGEKATETKTEEKGKNVHRTERTWGRFERSFALPPHVDTAKVKATCRNGVLEVTLPKTAPTKAIAVKVD